MTTTRRTRAVIAATTLVLGACAASTPDDGDGTGGPANDIEIPELDDGDSSDPAGGATEVTAPLPDDTADLPVSPPDAPTTDGDSGESPPTGPLPIPAVQLVDIGDFDTPVEVTSRPGDQRTFVVEQTGRVVAVDDLDTSVVADLTSLTRAGGEQGLLGLAFHPERDLAYVDYTDTDGTTVVAEFEIDPTTAVFALDTRRIVLTVDQPFGNHNGGEVAFGPDGYLYVGLGDGGSAGDPVRAGLDLGSKLGKILRIDPLEADTTPFTVPESNPFVETDGADPTIWSLGLRNPWKFSFDEETGDLWIADVGQNEFEEVNRAPATNGLGAGRGLSFGWSAFEANQRFNEDQTDDRHTPPTLVYDHSDGRCSVSGGAVARGDAVPDLRGWYVYGDFCTGQIWGYDTTSPSDAPVIVELAQLGNLVAIAIGANDELYAVSNAGTVARIARA